MKKMLPLIDPHYLASILSRVARDLLMPNYKLMPMKLPRAQADSYVEETLAMAEDVLKESLAELVPQANFVTTYPLLLAERAGGDDFWAQSPLVVHDKDTRTFDPDRAIILIDAFDGAKGFAMGSTFSMPFAVNMAFIEAGQIRTACSYQPLSSVFLYADNKGARSLLLSLDAKFGAQYEPSLPALDMSEKMRDVYCFDESEDAVRMPSAIYADENLVETTTTSTCAAASVADLCKYVGWPRHHRMATQAFIHPTPPLPTRFMPLADIVTKRGGYLCNIDAEPYDPFAAQPRGVVMSLSRSKAVRASALAYCCQHK